MFLANNESVASTEMAKSWNWYLGESWLNKYKILLDSFSLVTLLCQTLCNPMDCSMPGFPVHQQLWELAQTLVHWVGDAIQPSHPLSSPSPPSFNLSQHQGLFKWVSSLHQVTKVLELQLQHQFFQWNQFNSVQPLSRVWLFGTPWTSLSITNSQSLLKLMSIE